MDSGQGTTVNDLDDIFEEGRTSRKLGVPAERNPFSWLLSYYKANIWHAGWMSGRGTE